MKNLLEATERICELKGSLIALDALASSVLCSLSEEQRAQLLPMFERHAEVARLVLIHTPISEHTIAAFERDVARTSRLVGPDPAPLPAGGIERMLLTTVRVATFEGSFALTAASGFFFERDERLFLVTSRHVLFDEASGHRPDRIEIAVHTDERDLSRCAGMSMLLYRRGLADWREAADAGGPIDVAVLELDRSMLPAAVVLHAFTPADVPPGPAGIEAGGAVSIVGYPLGFHDDVHHLPVVRQAAIASSFGLRFQGRGCFLTDARTHRGTSGAPVLARRHWGDRRDDMPWALLGVHSSRFDVGDRDPEADESLGLNCAWYADVLLALTAD